MVALTSHLMKTLERLFLNFLKPQVQHVEDFPQFCFQVKVGVEEAIIHLLRQAHSGQGKPHCEDSLPGFQKCLQHNPDLYPTVETPSNASGPCPTWMPVSTTTSMILLYK